MIKKNREFFKCDISIIKNAFKQVEQLYSYQTTNDQATKIYYCKKCDKKYESYPGLFRHNKKYHPNSFVKKQPNNQCKYCEKVLSDYSCKWRHEKKCKFNNKNMIKNVNELINEVNYLKEQVKKSNTQKLHTGINEEEYHNKDLVKSTWEYANFDENERIYIDLNVDSDEEQKLSHNFNSTKKQLINKIANLLNEIKNTNI